ncbi:hypothetical protein EZ456_19765 [Pedobacter psychrodurus]|uniref:Uncharacterized protein n=1 Tax=Pedobacter psychrodurus TaxID=2530456 RepID=A0A4R0PPX1_9SPHI|nr:hypothetical protein [Pedobacter psychrodurus]TCD20384.1 hypothetical protein EZ456_19765 [Pedobacter psychrodurus]
MKIKTLQDLSDNFEVLSRTEEKETLGGVNLISAYDGNIYDLDMSYAGYINSPFSDTDPFNLGGSFSYVVDDGYGTPITISVNESDWGSNAYGPNRFTLLYVGLDFDINASSTDKFYYDNVTGYTFSANLFRSMQVGGGYEYESLPDITVSDNDMGEYSGYTIFQSQLQKYLNYDDLTGAYYDYSQINSTATHYDADYVGMTAAGYEQQAINAQIARDNANRASSNDMSGLMNHLNGSKLYAAQKAWTDNPMNHGVPFDYAAYANSSQPITVLNISGPGGGAFALKDFYLHLKDQLGVLGYDYLMKMLHRIP